MLFDPMTVIFGPKSTARAGRTMVKLCGKFDVPSLIWRRVRRTERSSHGSLVKVNLGSTYTGTHVTYCWWQEGHSAKTIPVNHKVLPLGMSEPLST